MTQILDEPTLPFNRAAEHRTDADWVAAERLSTRARFLLLCRGRACVHSNAERTSAEIRWFSADELTKAGADPNEAWLLGCRRDGHTDFAAGIRLPRDGEMPDHLRPAVDLRSLARQGAMPTSELSVISLALSLSAWHRSAAFCGRCGAPTVIVDAGWRRRCSRCEHMQFPRVDPAVIMLVTNGDRCLLGRETRFPEKMFSTLAGFVDPGESFEVAVCREVFEETGLVIGRVHYVASQSWPYPHSLMIGCVGEALTTELRLDPTEIADARWFGRNELHLILAGKHPDGLFVPPPFSIAHRLIRRFADAG